MNTPTDQILAPEDNVNKGPGPRLREARTAAGLGIEEVSARLHLDRKTLESLEADDFSNLPAPTFVRGYLRAYARLLDLPPGPVVEAFDRRGLEPPALIPDIASQSESRGGDLWMIASTVLILGILGALAAVWYQGRQEDEPALVALPTGEAIEAPESTLPGPAPAVTPAVPPITPPTVSVAPVPAPVSTPVPAPVAAPETEPAAAEPSPPAPAATPALAATEDRAAGGGTQSAAPADGPVPSETPRETSGEVDVSGIPQPPLADARRRPAPPPPTPDPGAPPGGSPATGDGAAHVVIRVVNDAWIEIYGAGGERVFYDLARAGQRVDVRGTPPLRVLLGYVEGLQMEYNGEPFDFSPYVSRGIARFELGR